MLYQPRLGEIRPIMNTIRGQHPHLQGYAERAEQILLDGAIIWKDDNFHIYSQNVKTAGAAYCVANGNCSCPSFQDKRTPAVHGETFCKHKIALFAYLQILEQHLHYRIYSGGTDAHNRQISRLCPMTYLIFAGTNMLFTHTGHNKGIGLPICKVRFDWSGHKFADDHEAANFAQWLQLAAPLPTPQEAEEITAATMLDFNSWREIYA